MGRIVHVYTMISGPHAALVTAVHPSNEVTVTVFPPDSVPYSRKSVPPRFSGYDTDIVWEWPPRA